MLIRLAETIDYKSHAAEIVRQECRTSYIDTMTHSGAR